MRDKSVHVWSRGSYSLYNATKADKFREKLTLLRRFNFRHFVYSVNSSAITPQNDTSKFATIAVDFVDNLNLSCPLFHLRNVA